MKDLETTFEVSVIIVPDCATKRSAAGWATSSATSEAKPETPSDSAAIPAPLTAVSAITDLAGSVTVIVTISLKEVRTFVSW